MEDRKKGGSVVCKAFSEHLVFLILKTLQVLAQFLICNEHSIKFCRMSGEYDVGEGEMHESKEGMVPVLGELTAQLWRQDVQERNSEHCK